MLQKVSPNECHVGLTSSIQMNTSKQIIDCKIQTSNINLSNMHVDGMSPMDPGDKLLINNWKP